RTFDLRLLAGGTRVSIELFPALLPFLHRFLGLGERGRRGLLALARGDQTGLELLQLLAQRFDLRLIARQMRRRFSRAALGLFEVLLLSLAQLARMLDRLLGAR